MEKPVQGGRRLESDIIQAEVGDGRLKVLFAIEKKEAKAIGELASTISDLFEHRVRLGLLVGEV